MTDTEHAGADQSSVRRASPVDKPSEPVGLRDQHHSAPRPSAGGDRAT